MSDSSAQGTPIPPRASGLRSGPQLSPAKKKLRPTWHALNAATPVGKSTKAKRVKEDELIEFAGRTRHDFGRDVFVGKGGSGGRTTGLALRPQLRRLGGRHDWHRVAFALNETLSKAVMETFDHIHEEGIINRASRLVNWGVGLNTTLSNLEMARHSSMCLTSEFGVITTFAYLIEGSDEKIIVATTRPETVLDDNTIAVHPELEDARFKHLHGKFTKHPFVERGIPIITDNIAVDMASGPGRAARVQVEQALKGAEYGEAKDNPMQIEICASRGT
ncbi:tRNA synthetases class I-domain-containing protein [Ganoderma leucocontextum]|nr:tRNA synthetases class I-domain-containing protein [Ganoderma leucocontextum]